MRSQRSHRSSSTASNAAGALLASTPGEVPFRLNARSRTGPNAIVVGLVTLLAAAVVVFAVGSRTSRNRRVATVTPSTERDEVVSPAPQLVFRDFGPSASGAPRVIGQAAPAAGPDPGTMPAEVSESLVLPKAKVRADKEIKALEQSGPASSALTASAVKAVENLKKVHELAGAEWSDFRCFGNGCAVTATSKDVSSAQTVGQAIMQSEHFLAWSGPKFRSGPVETPSGQVQTIVILYRHTESTSPVTPEQ
jgi:hypothetical protein